MEELLIFWGRLMQLRVKEEPKIACKTELIIFNGYRSIR